MPTAEYHREWYAKNKEKRGAQIAARNKRQRAEMRDYVRSIKAATPCAECRQSFPHYVMDFDHVRGEKVRAVAELVAACASKATIDAEIAKCEVVCSNCHRKRTWERAGVAPD